MVKWLYSIVRVGTLIGIFSILAAHGLTFWQWQWWAFIVLLITYGSVFGGPCQQKDTSEAK